VEFAVGEPPVDKAVIAATIPAPASPADVGR
jgi:hypothetical protein